MSLSRMIGEMFIVGFDGLNPSAEFRSFAKTGSIGGVILFKRNIDTPEQVRGLTRQLSCDFPNLIISVDQEGGRVSRLPFLKYPCSLELAALGDEKLVYDSCQKMALELEELGINMNYAPVLDVNTNPANPVIGDRAFGSTPEAVVKYGIAAIRGFEETGMISCAKHFPGHGGTSEDSHLSLPEVLAGRDDMDKVELRPFKEAVACGVSSIMTAHVLYPGLDDKPATFSKKILGILRDELSYDNLIITDDLEMGAVSKYFDPCEVAVDSILAGADILLVCHSMQLAKKMIKHVHSKVKDKTIPEERIFTSYQRIRKIKRKFGLI